LALSALVALGATDAEAVEILRRLCDVCAWKHDEVLFAESKRAKRDAVRANQLHWLEAALVAGYDPESFLLVEWTLA
jgi:hypothetical protein